MQHLESLTSDETQSSVSEQLEAERRTLNKLRKALQRSKGQESDLTEALEEREAETQQRRQEEERQRQARQLQYYRALEAERERWEPREQRALALADVDRLRQDNDVTTSADYLTLTGQLEEACQQQTRLKGELEGSQTEKELGAELADQGKEVGAAYFSDRWRWPGGPWNYIIKQPA